VVGDFAVVYFPGLVVFPPVFAALVARTADIAHTSGLVVLAPTFVVVPRMTDSIVVVVERLEPVLSLIASLPRMPSVAPLTGNTLQGMVLVAPRNSNTNIGRHCEKPIRSLVGSIRDRVGLVRLHENELRHQ
jgi:hypothetical protein